MPQPDYQFIEYDPDELPDPRMEVMGRGSHNRKSKTLLPNIRLAALLGLTREHIRHLFELFRKLHAEHYTTEIEVEDAQGKKTRKVVPEVLTDDQIRALYPSVKKWESFHQEQVDHYPSVGGFSTRAALSYEDNKERKERKDTSAGTDRASRWE